jgi:hypothetical protein
MRKYILPSLLLAAPVLSASPANSGPVAIGSTGGCLSFQVQGGASAGTATGGLENSKAPEACTHQNNKVQSAPSPETMKANDAWLKQLLEEDAKKRAQEQGSNNSFKADK